MTRTSLRRGLAMAALIPLLTGLAACGEDDKDATGGPPGSRDCRLLPSADPAAKLPAGFPARDQVLYEPSTQGKTHIVFGLVDAANFVEVRDDYVERLTAAGWTIDGTDQESVEAEAQFSKKSPPVTGSIKVEPYCKGYVSIRYRESA